jgi:hypothetical protein
MYLCIFIIPIIYIYSIQQIKTTSAATRTLWIMTVDCWELIKWKTKIPNFNRKIVERGKIDTKIIVNLTFHTSYIDMFDVYFIFKRSFCICVTSGSKQAIILPQADNPYQRRLVQKSTQNYYLYMYMSMRRCEARL